MKRLAVIQHGHCSVCDTDKTVAIYRDDAGDLAPPVCGPCEVRGIASDALKQAGV